MEERGNEGTRGWVREKERVRNKERVNEGTRERRNEETRVRGTGSKGLRVRESGN